MSLDSFGAQSYVDNDLAGSANAEFLPPEYAGYLGSVVAHVETSPHRHSPGVTKFPYHLCLHSPFTRTRRQTRCGIRHGAAFDQRSKVV